MKNRIDKIDRKEFLEIVGKTAGAVSVSSVLWTSCKEDVKKAVERTSVIWLQGQACSGCSISLLNTVNPDIPEFITKYISLNFHQTLSTGTGHKLLEVIRDAVDKKRKDYILIVEGSIPTASNNYCTIGIVNDQHISMEKWVTELGKNAKTVVAVGTCAAFGGIPAARGDVTGAKPLSAILKNREIVNIQGCPAYPDWVVLTLIHILLHGKPDLDEYSRPKMFFSKTVHETCPRLQDYKKAKFAHVWGDDGCLYKLGCLGMDTNCDISKRKWLGVNSCTASGSGCIGCTESVFPDTGERGLYQHMRALGNSGTGVKEV
jgi:hydrogenase small subunit